MCIHKHVDTYVRRKAMTRAHHARLRATMSHMYATHTYARARKTITQVDSYFRSHRQIYAYIQARTHTQSLHDKH